MTKGQIILLSSAIALVGVLYFFVSITPKKQDANRPSANRDKTAEHQHDDFDFAAYRAEILNALPAEVREAIEQSDVAVKTADAGAKKELLLEQKKLFLENRSAMLAAYALLQIAEADNDAESWNTAGNMFMASVMSEQENAALADYGMHRATECYQKASDLKPENTDYKINLASALMEGGKQTMQGVQMLLGIIEQHPDNIPANLILGRFGIVSGQYDKAVARLEKVVKLDPKNTEAYFYLAEAYNGLGRKDDAIKTFEQCKKLVDDPGFSAEIDLYILKIKNS
jgi:cytochrome c-type biogenesis protein CcmH/NrfG